MITEKIAALKEIFATCTTREARYEKIIQLGRASPRLPEQAKIPENRVSGCQSTLYLQTTLENGHLYVATEADALISAGLGQLLTRVYSGEPPENILKYKPTYLEELDIAASLSPSRANGLASLFLRMQQEAVSTFVEP